MNAQFQRAAEAANKTLDDTKRLIASLETIALGNRQKLELKQFLEVFCGELENRTERLANSDSDLDLQLLITRQIELEEANQFLERSFVQPRKTGTDIQILEAADWMCVEGYQLLVGNDKKYPVGPIVAIDASQSPAIWGPDADLPIPSLFKTKPKHVSRGESLGEFPLICLPQHIARTPEYWPLLSHEVGHAVDTALGLTTQICKRICESQFSNYWRAWMREMVADSIGIALSGEAYAVALENFLRLQPPFDEVADDHSYPPFELRLKFIANQLNSIANEPLAFACSEDASCLDDLSNVASEIFDEFKGEIASVIQELVLSRVADWNEHQQWALDQAKTIESNELNELDCENRFRLLPSAVCLAKFRDQAGGSAAFDSYQALRKLHALASSVSKKPDWIQGSTNWEFSEEYLPALRPTLLSNSRFKVPPIMLLTTHQKIAFVGATNWQLKKILEEAFKMRGKKPWKKIVLFFASKRLLANIEYGKREAKKFNDRKKAKQKLLAGFRDNGWAKTWEIYQFDGPPVFASYWDWDKPAGRIHISPALLGTEIGKCPATDLVWSGDVASFAYNKYLAHLNGLLQSAKLLACKN